MGQERRFHPGQVRVRVRKADKQSVITGLGAVFYDGTEATEYELWNYGDDDRAVERILPGAFSRAIKEDDVRGLFNHDANLVLGRNTAKTLRLRETKAGLEYTIEPAETSTSQDVVEHIRRGDVTGSSFAFRVIFGDQGEETWRIKDGLTIREVVSVGVLYDVGPVTFPAYEAATAELKAAGGIDAARESFERWKAARDTNTKHRRNRLLKLRLLGLRI
jgi:HK97 family phage prohead protease